MGRYKYYNVIYTHIDHMKSDIYDKTKQNSFKS